MEQDMQKYAERKMPFFNLAVSIWSHNYALKETIGLGFTNSVFTHKEGICTLYASQKEITLITSRIVELIRSNSNLFHELYKKAKELNIQADNILLQYQQNKFTLDIDSYKRIFQTYTKNFDYCTIIPYWVLYSINQALEKGESKTDFEEVLQMNEELKSESRYPQMIQTVFSHYIRKGTELLSISPEYASCISSDELKDLLSGKSSLSVVELERRWNWCAITRKDMPYEVNVLFDKKILPSISGEELDENLNQLRGKVAYRGNVKGTVKIVNSLDDMNKFIDGDILISFQSNPSLMPAIKRCSAIITDEGGVMCHAAIISRELKKPCIIGTKVATKVFKDGDLIEVDADRGIIKIIKRA